MRPSELRTHAVYSAPDDYLSREISNSLCTFALDLAERLKARRDIAKKDGNDTVVFMIEELANILEANDCGRDIGGLIGRNDAVCMSVARCFVIRVRGESAAYDERCAFCRWRRSWR
jgi:hypothetical protein